MRRQRTEAVARLKSWALEAVSSLLEHVLPFNRVVAVKRGTRIEVPGTFAFLRY